MQDEAKRIINLFFEVTGSYAQAKAASIIHCNELIKSVQSLQMMSSAFKKKESDLKEVIEEIKKL